MKTAVRLILNIIIIYMLYITQSWFTIIYHIGSLKVSIIYVYLLLLLFYFFVEIFEYLYPKATMEFSTFFFWFIYIIVFISLYLTIIQAFMSSIMPKDFLMKTDYISVHIVYSTKYMLEYFSRYLEIIIQANKVDLTDDIITLIQSIHITTRIETITSLEDVQKLAAYCVELAHEVFHTSTKIITYNPERDPIIFSTIVRLLKFFFVLNFSCYTVPQFFFRHINIDIDIPSYIFLDLLQNQYRDFLMFWLRHNFPELIFDMTAYEYYDFCSALMPWLLKHYESHSHILLYEIIKYLLLS